MSNSNITTGKAIKEGASHVHAIAKKKIAEAKSKALKKKCS